MGVHVPSCCAPVTSPPVCAGGESFFKHHLFNLQSRASCTNDFGFFRSVNAVDEAEIPVALEISIILAPLPSGKCVRYSKMRVLFAPCGWRLPAPFPPCSCARNVLALSSSLLISWLNASRLRIFSEIWRSNSESIRFAISGSTCRVSVFMVRDSTRSSRTLQQVFSDFLQWVGKPTYWN